MVHFSPVNAPFRHFLDKSIPYGIGIKFMLFLFLLTSRTGWNGHFLHISIGQGFVKVNKLSGTDFLSSEKTI